MKHAKKLLLTVLSLALCHAPMFANGCCKGASKRTGTTQTRRPGDLAVQKRSNKAQTRTKRSAKGIRRVSSSSAVAELVKGRAANTGATRKKTLKRSPAATRTQNKRSPKKK
jgi:hypothetical protein